MKYLNCILMNSSDSLSKTKTKRREAAQKQEKKGDDLTTCLQNHAFMC
jgi:hypothetical protein